MIDDIEKENTHRLRRIETKVSKLLVAAGIEEGTTMPISLQPSTMLKPAKLTVQGFDINMSSLKRYLRATEDVHEFEPLDIYIGDKKVAKLTFMESEHDSRVKV